MVVIGPCDDSAILSCHLSGCGETRIESGNSTSVFLMSQSGVFVSLGGPEWDITHFFLGRIGNRPLGLYENFTYGAWNLTTWVNSQFLKSLLLFHSVSSLVLPRLLLGSEVSLQTCLQVSQELSGRHGRKHSAQMHKPIITDRQEGACAD